MREPETTFLSFLPNLYCRYVKYRANGGQITITKNLNLLWLHVLCSWFWSCTSPLPNSVFVFLSPKQYLHNHHGKEIENGFKSRMLYIYNILKYSKFTFHPLVGCWYINGYVKDILFWCSSMVIVEWFKSFKNMASLLKKMYISIFLEYYFCYLYVVELVLGKNKKAVCYRHAIEHCCLVLEESFAKINL